RSRLQRSHRRALPAASVCSRCLRRRDALVPYRRSGVGFTEHVECGLRSPPRITLGVNALPHYPFLGVVEEDPIGHFHGGASTAATNVVKERGANRDAR